MAICLLLIALLGIFLLSFDIGNIRLSIVKTVLYFSLCVLGVTELLGLFTSLNLISLIVCWTLIDIFLILFLIKKKSFHAVFPLKERVKRILLDLNNWEKFLLGFSTFIVLGVLVQGLIYPTNNWDSMSYHMARIIHWIQNENLAHFRTPIYPQLSSAPFAEELTLNVNLLLGNDYLSNAIELFYLIATSIISSLIAKELGFKRFGQIFSVFILICIPEVILLSSSTHNEIMLSFFMVMGIYFLLKTLAQQTIINFILLGCCLGLAAATKHTAYIYIAPFLLIWMVYHGYIILFRKQKILWLHFLLVVVSFTVINSAHYSRNYQLTSNIFGSDEDIHNYYVNEEHSLKMMISNVTRNISYQFGFPKIAPVVFDITKGLHELMNEDIHNPKTTYDLYSIDPLATHENNGSNIYHAVLIILSMVWMFIFLKKHNPRLTVYWIAIVLAFLLFCFYLKWVPWAKLHAPFFIFYSIVLAHFIINTLKSKILFSIAIFGFVSYATLIMLFNWSRPYITLPPFTSEIKITDDRYQKYFSRFLKYHADFKKVDNIITSNNFKNIGLMYGRYGIEYQLFLNSYRNDVKPIHINAHRLAESIPVSGPVDCIVSSKYDHLIEYEGEIFYNVTKDNDGYIYLFLKK